MSEKNEIIPKQHAFVTNYMLSVTKTGGLVVWST